MVETWLNEVMRIWRAQVDLPGEEQALLEVGAQVFKVPECQVLKVPAEVHQVVHVEVHQVVHVVVHLVVHEAMHLRVLMLMHQGDPVVIHLVVLGEMHLGVHEVLEPLGRVLVKHPDPEDLGQEETHLDSEARLLVLGDLGKDPECKDRITGTLHLIEEVQVDQEAQDPSCKTHLTIGTHMPGIPMQEIPWEENHIPGIPMLSHRQTHGPKMEVRVREIRGDLRPEIT